jgi:Head domain of trimeric autotransporter adhesin
MTFVLKNDRPFAVGRTLQRDVVSTRSLRIGSLVTDSLTSLGGTVQVLEEAVDVATVSSMNFVGASVAVTESPVGTAVVTVTPAIPTLAQVLTTGVDADNHAITDISSLALNQPVEPTTIFISTEASNNNPLYSENSLGTTFGTNAYASNEYDIAIGKSATTNTWNQSSSIAIGNSASQISRGISIGKGAISEGSGRHSVAIGSAALAYSSGTQQIAIGHNSESRLIDSIAIGRDSLSTHNRAISVGEIASCTNTESVSLGYSAACAGSRSVALGYDTTATGDSTVAIGNATQALTWACTAIGNGALASNQTTSLSLGTGTIVAGDQSLAIGYTADCQTTFGLCIGAGANCGTTTASQRSIVIGKDADSVNVSHSIVLGSQAVATASNQLTINLSNTATQTLQTTFSRDAVAPAAGGLAIPSAVTFWQVKFGATSYKIPLLNTA